jgi:hypothetical protein
VAGELAAFPGDGAIRAAAAGEARRLAARRKELLLLISKSAAEEQELAGRERDRIGELTDRSLPPRLAKMAGAAMTKSLKRASTAEAGCATLAAVCLRQSDNAKQAAVLGEQRRGAGLPISLRPKSGGLVAARAAQLSADGKLQAVVKAGDMHRVKELAT